MKGLALGLTLKQRRKPTRKSPIYLYMTHFLQVEYDTRAFEMLEKIAENERNLFNTFLESGRTREAFGVAIAVLSLLDKKKVSTCPP